MVGGAGHLEVTDLLVMYMYIHLLHAVASCATAYFCVFGCVCVYKNLVPAFLKVGPARRDKFMK